jgi:hypothetical protein
MTSINRNNLTSRDDAPIPTDMALVVVPKGTGPGGEIEVLVEGIAGIADAGNSTDDPLGVASVFVGTWFDAQNYASAQVQLWSDVPSLAGGLRFEWTDDPNVGDIRYVSAFTFFPTNPPGQDDGAAFSIDINHKARYFRIAYTNNLSTGQIAFQVRTYHRSVPVEDQLIPYGDPWNSREGNVGGGGDLSGVAPTDVRGFASVSFSLSATTASAANGLELQWSNDATTFNAADKVRFAIAAGQEFNIELPHLARYFKVVYTNGAATSAVKYQAIHNKVATPACVTAANVATVTRVAVSTVSVTLLAANHRRKSVLITNYSPGSQVLYVKVGSAASITAGSESFTAILNNGGSFKLEKDECNSIITGIWGAADANGAALITETVYGS